MKGSLINVLGIAALCSMTATNAESGADVGVGAATVLQLQLDGQDNIQESMVGHLDTDIENTVILVGQANVVQVQTAGNNNLQTSYIGTHASTKR